MDDFAVTVMWIVGIAGWVTSVAHAVSVESLFWIVVAVLLPFISVFHGIWLWF